MSVFTTEFSRLIAGPPLIDEDGSSLMFEPNAHLFQWPGALVYGEKRPETTSVNESPYVDEGIKQWRNKRIGNEPVPVQSPKVEGNPFDFGVIRRLRQQLCVRDEDVYQVGTARPTMSGAFDIIQANKKKRSPYANLLSFNPDSVLRQQETDNPDSLNTYNKEPRFSNTGACWLANWIANQGFAVRPFSQDLADLLGPQGVAITLFRYLSYNLGVGEISGLVRVASDELNQMIYISNERLLQVEMEVALWAVAGTEAVLTPDGSVDDTLSLINAATAITGLSRLATYGRQMALFQATAQSFMSELEKLMGF